MAKMEAVGGDLGERTANYGVAAQFQESKLLEKIAIGPKSRVGVGYRVTQFGP